MSFTAAKIASGLRNLIPNRSGVVDRPVAPSAGRATTLAAFRSYGPQALAVVLYVVLSLRLFRVVSRLSVNIFYGDAWAFDYYLLSAHHSWWQMFSLQYGPHRQGVGAILMYCLGNWSRWSSRVEAFAAAAIIVSAAGAALLLKKRLYGRITYSDALVPLLILVPSQFPMLILGPNISHGPFPLLLLILYCLAWTVRSEISKYGLVLLLNFLLLYTGFGLFVGFLTPLLLVLDFYQNVRGEARKKRVYAIVAICLSAASLAAFFTGYTLGSAVLCYGSQDNARVSFDARSLPDYVWFVSLMLANFFGIKGVNVWSNLVGGFTLAACISWLAFSLRRLIAATASSWAAYAVPTLLLSYCLIFVLLAALGRLCVSWQAAQQARYVPYLALGMLGLYFSILSFPVVRARNVSLVVLSVLVLFASVSISSADRGMMLWLSHGKKNWKSCYLREHDVERCDGLTNFRVIIDPDPKARQEKLDFLQRNRLNLYAD